MIKAIKQFFDENLHQTPDQQPPKEHDLQIAAAALLFEISRSDESTSAGGARQDRRAGEKAVPVE